MNPVPSKLVVADVWRPFYETPTGLMASAVARAALSHTCFRGDVLTLGFEVLNDPVFFLEHEFRSVHNVNLAPSRPPQHLDSIRTKYRARFRHDECLVTDLTIAPNKFDVLVSNHGIAYHPDLGFEAFFENLKTSLRSDGIIGVTLFGAEDEWLPNHQGYSSHDADEISGLFTGFEILSLKERRFDGHYIDTGETPKRWHFHTVIARKRSEL